MSETLAIAESQRVWGTFDDVRQRLFNQFQDVPFDPETGLEVDELRREVEDYLRAHGDQPRVLRKANAFRIVVTRGQIHVDPLHWFADKLNHGGIVKALRDAQLHPERYASLQIRVTGWSAYFVTLSTRTQDHFITRTVHGM